MMDFNATQKPTAQGNAMRFSHAANGSADESSAKVSARPKKQKRPLLSKQTTKWAGIICLIIVVFFVVRAGYRHIVYAGIDTNRYQAVYLTNDNVYFGRVHTLVSGDIFLTDVFRVQAASTNTAQASGSPTTSGTTTSTQNAAPTGDIRLIKPGKELHAPDDTMLINRGNVLFIENLKSDGKVTQAILQYHKDNSSN